MNNIFKNAARIAKSCERTAIVTSLTDATVVLQIPMQEKIKTVTAAEIKNDILYVKMDCCKSDYNPQPPSPLDAYRGRGSWTKFNRR